MSNAKHHDKKTGLSAKQVRARLVTARNALNAAVDQGAANAGNLHPAYDRAVLKADKALDLVFDALAEIEKVTKRA